MIMTANKVYREVIMAENKVYRGDKDCKKKFTEVIMTAKKV